MLSVKCVFFLFASLCCATWAYEQHEVVMIAAHESQCTHDGSKCVQAIKQYVADYFSPFDDEDVDNAGGLRRRELFSCVGKGRCDSSANDFLMCIIYSGCGRRRNRQLQEGDGVFKAPMAENCYLAGQIEDDTFKTAILQELGAEYPCIQATSFLVQICEYPDE